MVDLQADATIVAAVFAPGRKGITTSISVGRDEDRMETGSRPCGGALNVVDM
jgi:hypothetical protein